MRRHVAVLTLAWMALLAPAAGAVPAVEEAAAITPATVAVQRVSVPFTGLRDEAAMLLIGTALIGLAGAVRRAR